MFLFRRFAIAWSAGWHCWCHALLTPAYAGLTLGLGLLAAGLVLPTNGLPVGAKYLLMLALLGWLARLGNLPGLRGVWRAAAGLALLGLGLELLT